MKGMGYTHDINIITFRHSHVAQTINRQRSVRVLECEDDLHAGSKADEEKFLGYLPYVVIH